MSKKTVRDIDINGKKVLMRVDFNVPFDDKMNITDDSRIKAALPTIKYVLDNNAKLILMSHLGRPKGTGFEKEFSLAPVAAALSKLIKRPVQMAKDCVGDDVKRMVDALNCGDVLLLENLRFHKEESDNNEEFAKKLASLGEVFVMDAFGTCHRAHASTAGITKFLPSVAGFLVEKEIQYFEQLIKSPVKPVTLILGGAKVSDKIAMIENMLPKVNFILIGGAMAYTFLKSRLKGVGNSKVEADKIDLANKIFKLAREHNVGIFLPQDHVVAKAVDAKSKAMVVIEHIPDGWIGLDIGPKTIKKFRSVLKDSKTIFWNGPLGYFEIKRFSRGTAEVAKFITRLKATTVIGGGDTAAAINALRLGNRMTHISTGGGASLEYLEGKGLSGIIALNDK